jgi:hypothetical protein
VLLAVVLLPACKSTGFDGRTYKGDGMEFQVGAQPSTWQRLDHSHALLAFRDDSHGATVVVNGRCGKDGDDVPLAALTQHLFLQFTERQIEEEETIPFDGREARRTVLSAKLDGVPKRFEAYVAKKDGCVYDFILVAQPETFAGARPDFDRFVRGFHAETRR